MGQNLTIEEKAARWDALMQCDRIRILGHAGLNNDQNGYFHIGLEIWSKHPEKISSCGAETISKFAQAIIDYKANGSV